METKDGYIFYDTRKWQDRLFARFHNATEILSYFFIDITMWLLLFLCIIMVVVIVVIITFITFTVVS